MVMLAMSCVIARLVELAKIPKSRKMSDMKVLKASLGICDECDQANLKTAHG
jgi:hypothetical protein